MSPKIGTPEPDESWRKDGSIVHYADLHILAFQQPEKTGILKADDLKKAIPEIDWDKGSSGVLIEENIAEKLALFIAESLLSVGEKNCNNDNIAICNGNGGCWTCRTGQAGPIIFLPPSAVSCGEPS